MVAADVVGLASSYEADLRRAEAQIAALEAELRVEPADAERATRLVYRRYHVATLTGDLARLAMVSAAAERAAVRFGSNEDLALVQATIEMTFHRWERVRPHLETLPALMEHPEARALIADIHLETGDLARARAEYESLVAAGTGWADVSRLAHLEAIAGRVTAADDLYADAQDTLTAKDMRPFAWLEAKRGLLDLRGGRYDDADQHYRRADAAYSGYWLIEEHRAELAAARGQYDEGIERYQRALSEAPRPELHHAFGDALARAGRAEAAESAHARALAGFLASADRGEVHYLHHLAQFYADVRLDGDEAVRWAEADLRLRPGPFPRAALAWALHRCDRHDEAVRAMELVLASGVRTAPMLRRAAAIHRSAGRIDDATALSTQASALDPCPGDFRAPR